MQRCLAVYGATIKSEGQAMNNISSLLKDHYAKKFSVHGATPEGVDWGTNPADHLLRLDRMLAVLEVGEVAETKPSLLDVGCGYGSLLDRAKLRGISMEYSGVDVCTSMINTAQTRHPDAEWIAGDVLNIDKGHRFDYVVCNGVLTQKLNASIRDMDQFLLDLVSRMFDICRIGVAFNVMTTHVNFMVPNLYYRNPVELMGWCMTALTSRIRLDHAYPMYEYTMYLYREDAPGLTYGTHREKRP